MSIWGRLKLRWWGAWITVSDWRIFEDQYRGVTGVGAELDLLPGIGRVRVTALDRKRQRVRVRKIRRRRGTGGSA